MKSTFIVKNTSKKGGVKCSAFLGAINNTTQYNASGANVLLCQLVPVQVVFHKAIKEIR
jgi:hypothetical protein